jgi:hypothetical protein
MKLHRRDEASVVAVTALNLLEAVARGAGDIAQGIWKALQPHSSVHGLAAKTAGQGEADKVCLRLYSRDVREAIKGGHTGVVALAGRTISLARALTCGTAGRRICALAQADGIAHRQEWRDGEQQQ